MGEFAQFPTLVSVHQTNQQFLCKLAVCICIPTVQAPNSSSISQSQRLVVCRLSAAGCHILLLPTVWLSCNNCQVYQWFRNTSTLAKRFKCMYVHTGCSMKGGLLTYTIHCLCSQFWELNRHNCHMTSVQVKHLILATRKSKSLFTPPPCTLDATETLSTAIRT